MAELLKGKPVGDLLDETYNAQRQGYNTYSGNP